MKCGKETNMTKQKEAIKRIISRLEVTCKDDPEVVKVERLPVCDSPCGSYREGLDLLIDNQWFTVIVGSSAMCWRSEVK